MGAGTQELVGPDLTRGVALAELGEGQPFAAHLEGEAVLLVRAGNEVHAIGGMCTHYGAPLADGVVSGDMVRCPWHHACFSLRTGEAVAAPALNPVARWTTEIRGDRVYVTNRQQLKPLAATRAVSAGAPAAIVIVGAGAAGSAAAETLRREGYEGAITMIDPDAEAPYDRPNLSKDFLAGSAPAEWIPLRPSGFYQEHRIDRVVGTVTSIDSDARGVTLADGRRVEYGALLLATGASPIRLPIPGGDLPHVHVLRSLSDCRALMSAAAPGTRAVVAGASFIGMEAAASLRARGVDVTVVAPESVPFARTLGPELGEALRAVHEQHGVSFRLGQTLQSISPDHVTLSDGSSVPAELVLLGVGVRPMVALAEAAGLVVDNGVVVSDTLETSARGIFAAGDIARFPDSRSGQSIRVEHWVVAQRQGQTAARNMLGRAQPFESVPFFWTQHYDFALAYVGNAQTWDRIEVEGSIADRDCAVRYIYHDRVAAAGTVGRDRTSLQTELEMEQQVVGAQ